jgi:hypothetical protein
LDRTVSEPLERLVGRRSPAPRPRSFEKTPPKYQLEIVSTHLEPCAACRHRTPRRGVTSKLPKFDKRFVA